MDRLFGNKKTPGVPSQMSAAEHEANVAETVTRIDTRVQGLDERIDKLDLELGKYKAQLSKAREGPSKNLIKQRAMHVLKKKKQLELQRDTLMKQVFNIEHANAQVESLKASVDAVSLMKNTNVSLKAQMQNFDQDAIESMQDDFADMLDEVGYLQDTVTRSYGVPEDLDEEDLEAELAMLGEEFDLDQVDAEPSYLSKLPTPSRLNDPGSSATRSSTYPTMYSDK